MVQNGAEGETKTGILDTMNEKEYGINNRFNLLMNYFNALDVEEDSEIPGIRIKVANSMWIRKDIKTQKGVIPSVEDIKKYKTWV